MSILRCDAMQCSLRSPCLTLCIMRGICTWQFIIELFYRAFDRNRCVLVAWDVQVACISMHSHCHLKLKFKPTQRKFNF